MLWRHLWLVRAWSAAGLLTCTTFGASALAEPEEPAPAAGDVTKTVRILEARQAGDLALDVRGHGQETVRVAIQNKSDKRLNVILPPGLVATSALGQGGRGGGGGGFQSMGLGAVGNRAGGFGQFQNGTSESGFQSIPVTVIDEKPARAVTVPVGKTVELNLPSVCLNYGLPTPTPRDRFELVDVDQYSQNPRVRKALRSLATYGTSHGTAQAVMWNVCNNLPFEFMGEQTTKIMNVHEIALAARFVEGLDASGSNPTGLVDPAYLTEARIFVQIQGDGALAKEAERLNPASLTVPGCYRPAGPRRVRERGTGGRRPVLARQGRAREQPDRRDQGPALRQPRRRLRDMGLPGQGRVHRGLVRLRSRRRDPGPYARPRPGLGLRHGQGGEAIGREHDPESR